MQTCSGFLGLREPSVVAVARDRSILGSMTELAYGYDWRVARAGGPQHISARQAAQAAQAAQAVNETPMSRIDMESPIDAMRALLGYPSRHPAI